ncbi:hypothetical protein DASC09_002710 [Saccharomycopsis crataegensis]|uniref:Sterol regulatory element-binding protein cleavage-activating protein n=1 Tax=Saccharomycopsis crataegensis TaxID=43959 RepID=A0AAV5QDX2_9ASCO|nr:hypothetical protein DASC09_002710 [Saccharomycopsis crataegensis]
MVSLQNNSNSSSSIRIRISTMIYLLVANFLNAINAFLYSTASSLIQSYYLRLANSITRCPRVFILVPMSIAFIISYPTIYTLYTTPNLISLSSIENFKSIKVINEFNSSTPATYLNSSSLLSSSLNNNTSSLMIKQIWLSYNMGDSNIEVSSFDAGETYQYNALDKQFLLQALDFQNQLLKNIDLYNPGRNNNINNNHERVFENEDILHSSHSTSFLYSPLNFWNNCHETLQNDPNHLKTIQLTLRKKAGSSNTIPTNPMGLLGGVGKVNGLVYSAEALRISLVYTINSNSKHKQSPGDIWDDNLKKILSEKDSKLLVLSRDPEYKTYTEFVYQISKMSFIDKLILFISNLLIIIYFSISMLNVHGVKSKVGLLLAFVVEMILSSLSSVTITFYFFNDLDLLQIPVQILSFIVVVVGIENMFRLISTISNLKDSIFVPTKFSSLVSKSHITSSIIVAVDLLILIFITPFVSDSARQFCVFASIALIIDHLLHLTFFTAVLSVDIRRLELEDLLEKSRDDALSMQGNNGLATSKFLMKSKFKFTSFLSSAFPSSSTQRSASASVRHVLAQFLLKIKLPFSTSITSSIIMVMCIVIITIRWITEGITFNLVHLIGLGISSNNNNIIGANNLSTSDSIISFLKDFPITTSTSSIEEQNVDIYKQQIDKLQKRLNSDPKFPRSLFMNEKVLGMSISNLLGSYEDTIFQRFLKGSLDNMELKIFVEEPSYAGQKSKFGDLQTLSDFSLSDYVDNIPAATYKFNIYYLLEFLASLAFMLAVSAIIIKYCLRADSLAISSYDDGMGELQRLNESSEEETKFQSKELFGGHALDIVKISSNKASPFVVSIGMDHRVLVWSPAVNPIPQPTNLPVSRQIWPITHATLSMHGNLIAIFSRRGSVKIWSRLTMSWICSVDLPDLKNRVPLESFFRKKTVLGTMMRRKQQQQQQQQQQSQKLHSQSQHPVHKSPEKSQKEAVIQNLGVQIPPIQQQQQLQLSQPSTPVKHSVSRKSSISSLRSNTNKLQATNNNSYQSPPVNVRETHTESDFELTIVLKNGKMFTINCADGTFLETVVVKEELVTAKLVVSPRVNDRLVFGSKSGKIVVATVVNNKWRIRTLFIQEERYNRGKGLMTPLAMQRTTMRMMSGHRGGQLSRQSSMGSMTNVVVPPQVPPEDFEESSIVTVAFVGMIVRTHGLTAELIDVQTGTLVKRFHVGQFKKDSFHVFHEQPTHCRFCGCASVSSLSIVYTELDTNVLIMHTFSNANRAKNSICLRVERDPRETRCLGFDSVVEHQHWLENVECWELTELNMVQGIRKKSDCEVLNGKFDEGDFSRYNLTNMRSGKRFTSPKRKPCNVAPTHIADMWEGFTMNANGKVSYYDIPNGENEGLLVKKISSIARFGHKSIVVPFGNIMKVLYMGNDELILQNLDEDGNSNQKISGLSFVNKRRLRKTELMSSTNFGELPRMLQTQRVVNDPTNIVEF